MGVATERNERVAGAGPQPLGHPAIDELRRLQYKIASLQDKNASLQDKNASLEDENTSLKANIHSFLNGDNTPQQQLQVNTNASTNGALDLRTVKKRAPLNTDSPHAGERLLRSVSGTAKPGSASIRATAAIDVWSFGATMYELLTAQHFVSHNTYDNAITKDLGFLVQQLSNLPPDFEQLVFQFASSRSKRIVADACDLLRGCLAFEPSKRFTMEQICSHPFLSRDMVVTSQKPLQWYWRFVPGNDSTDTEHWHEMTVDRVVDELNREYHAWMNVANSADDDTVSDNSTYTIRRPDKRLSALWSAFQTRDVTAVKFEGGPGASHITLLSTRMDLEMRAVALHTQFPRAWGCPLDRAPDRKAVLVPIRNGSSEWVRMETKLQESLPEAKLSHLERVQNPDLWRSYEHARSQLWADGADVRVLGKPGSAVRELWHASSAGGIKGICLGNDGFDIRRAYKLNTVGNAALETIGAGGHVYGFGAYFARYAIYSHWWSTRVWFPKEKKPHKLILARVLTG